MKLSTTWANEWLCRTMSDHEIVEALERSGLEIEQFTSSKSIDKLIVVGLITKVVQHPQADRLHIVFVEVGGKQLRIVCGAPNVREGLFVAVAQVGTTLPGGDVIGSAKLRGEVSEGMLCSERELGLGVDHDGILELDGSSKVGAPLCDIFPADGLVDVKTHANRSDVLSVVGLAREIAAMTDTPLREIPSNELPKVKIEAMVEGKPAAIRYLLARISVTPASPSSQQISARLTTSGMRPISGLVDATNYAMLELGQPLHAFDAAKVKLPIEVRKATHGEQLKTLDGVMRKLSPEDIVIADASGPIALAGVMGGASTEVDEKTSEILLELASFDPALVRKSAQRHGLRSEASARMERGLPSKLPTLALNHALTLLQDLAGAKLHSISDYAATEPKTKDITLKSDRLSRLLGFEVSAGDAAGALSRLQIGATASAGTVTVASVPWWRTDLHLPEDLVEEIVRVVGYDAVPATIPAWRPAEVRFDTVRAKLRQLRDLMYAAGTFEVLTYSFVSADQLEELGLEPDTELKLKNPLSSEQGYLRTELLASHLQVAERNRRYAKELSFYEIANVFLPRRGQQPDEPQRLGLTVVCANDAFAAAKGVLDAIASHYNVKFKLTHSQKAGIVAARSATIQLVATGEAVGMIGQIDPELLRGRKIVGEAAHLELDLTPLFASASPVQMQSISRFPMIRRDIAVIVPQTVTWQAVSDALSEQSQAKVSYVNEYYGEDLPEATKSLALRLVLSHPDRTPTDAEANELEQRILSLLARKFGAKLR